MRDRDLEHPDVATAQRDGYPAGRGPRVVAICSECSEPICVGERVLKIGWGYICEGCLEDNIYIMEDPYETV